jgi:hypothetical protein
VFFDIDDLAEQDNPFIEAHNLPSLLKDHSLGSVVPNELKLSEVSADRV